MTAELAGPEFHRLQRAVAGRYSLVRELGRGGMGIVFLAREVSLDRLVAIKLLPPVLAADPSLRERFLREARTAAQLSHPHIVAIHAVESTDDVVFFVMEYVPGESLGDRLRRAGALVPSDATRIVQEVAWALAHAHARGVIHRDVKPDNILLEEGTDRAIVTDFGIAHASAADGAISNPAMGTFHYMSPEQATGGPVDARTDVYALGVTAFHALSGRRPFEGYDGAALLAQQASAPAPALESIRPTLEPRIARAIDRALARDRGDRWGGMEAMAQEFAAARAIAPRLPAPLIQFARTQLDFSDGLALTAGVAAAAFITALVIRYGSGASYGFDLIPFLYVELLSIGVAVLQVGANILRIRKLASSGYGRDAALRAMRQRETEEAAVQGPSPAGIAGSSRFMFALAVAAPIVGGLWSSGAEATVPSVASIILATGVPVLALRRALELRGITRRWWPRVLATKWGARIWGAIAVGLTGIPRRPTSGEPTALALGGMAGEIWGALPEAQRKALGAVPDLIARLEAMAMDRGHEKASDAITALETLRLDLLRLHAGEIAAESLTEDFRRLRDVGLYVDAAVEAGAVSALPANPSTH